MLLKKSTQVVAGLLFCFALLAGAVYLVSGQQALGSAEFSVTKMTCGSCANKISAALAKVPGVGEVRVNVGGGSATVTYADNKVSAETIARVITAAGYPASLAQVLSAAEVQALEEDATRLSARFVARVGQRLISREDFEGELALRSNSAGGADKGALRQALWREVQERELLLGAADLQGTVVKDIEVEQQIGLMRAGMADFDRMIETRFGGLAAFSKKVRQDMTIRRTLEEGVLKGLSDPAARQQKLEAWYQQLVATTPVLVLDPTLQAAGGGCSCCG